MATEPPQRPINWLLLIQFLSFVVLSNAAAVYLGWLIWKTAFRLMPMHVLALVVGAGINIWGDASLCLVATIIGMGREGTVYGQPFSYPSRTSALFELLPMPVAFMVGGFIVARWGFAGL